MLQKWLLCAGDLTDWQAGDLYEDGGIDVFDLCMMKRMLLQLGMRNSVGAGASVLFC